MYESIVSIAFGGLKIVFVLSIHVITPQLLQAYLSLSIALGRMRIGFIPFIQFIPIMTPQLL